MLTQRCNVKFIWTCKFWKILITCSIFYEYMEQLFVYCKNEEWFVTVCSRVCLCNMTHFHVSFIEIGFISLELFCVCCFKCMRGNCFILLKTSGRGFPLEGSCVFLRSGLRVGCAITLAQVDTANGAWQSDLPAVSQALEEERILYPLWYKALIPCEKTGRFLSLMT